MKATYAKVDGVGRALFKQPKTDSGKNSAKGLLRVEKENGKFVLYQEQTWEDFEKGELKPIFTNGTLAPVTPLSEIRSRVLG